MSLESMQAGEYLGRYILPLIILAIGFKFGYDWWKNRKINKDK